MALASVAADGCLCLFCTRGRCRARPEAEPCSVWLGLPVAVLCQVKLPGSTRGGTWCCVASAGDSWLYCSDRIVGLQLRKSKCARSTCMCLPQVSVCVYMCIYIAYIVFSEMCNTWSNATTSLIRQCACPCPCPSLESISSFQQC